MLGQLTPKLGANLQRNLQTLGVADQKGDSTTFLLRLGTLCAGTDMVVGVVEQLMVLVHTHLNVDVKVDFVFSCELDDTARRFAREFMPKPRMVFGDVGQMANTYILDRVSGQMVERPVVDLCIGGFACQSVSRLNGQARDFAGCIAAHQGTTGVTFAGCVGYLRQARPAIAILENVRSLGKAVDAADVAKAVAGADGASTSKWEPASKRARVPAGAALRWQAVRQAAAGQTSQGQEGQTTDNLSECVGSPAARSIPALHPLMCSALLSCAIVPLPRECSPWVLLLQTKVAQLAAAGYVAVAVDVYAQSHGSAQRRGRVYLLCFREDMALVHEHIQGTCQGAKGNSANAKDSKDYLQALACEALVGCRVPPLPLDRFLSKPEDAAQWLSVFRAGRFARSNEPKWVDRHELVFKAARLQWPTCDERWKHNLPAMVTDDILSVLSDRERDVLRYLALTGLGNRDVADLSQSIDRIPRCSDGTPCIVPGGHLFIAHLARPMTPVEMLRLQGVELELRELPVQPVAVGKGRSPGCWSWTELRELAGNASGARLLCGTVTLVALDAVRALACCL
jgi:site-specific DNA-cytosine methylase